MPVCACTLFRPYNKTLLKSPHQLKETQTLEQPLSYLSPLQFCINRSLYTLSLLTSSLYCPNHFSFLNIYVYCEALCNCYILLAGGNRDLGTRCRHMHSGGTVSEVLFDKQVKTYKCWRGLQSNNKRTIVHIENRRVVRKSQETKYIFKNTRRRRDAEYETHHNHEQIRNM